MSAGRQVESGGDGIPVTAPDDLSHSSLSSSSDAQHLRRDDHRSYYEDQPFHHHHHRQQQQQSSSSRVLSPAMLSVGEEGTGSEDSSGDGYAASGDQQDANRNAGRSATAAAAAISMSHMDRRAAASTSPSLFSMPDMGSIRPTTVLRERNKHGSTRGGGGGAAVLPSPAAASIYRAGETPVSGCHGSPHSMTAGLPPSQQPPPQPSSSSSHLFYFQPVREADPVCIASTASSKDWILLNVGGRLITTTISTLMSDPNSVLASICSCLTRQSAAAPPARYAAAAARSPLQHQQHHSPAGRESHLQEEAGESAAATQLPHSLAAPSMANAAAANMGTTNTTAPTTATALSSATPPPILNLPGGPMSADGSGADTDEDSGGDREMDATAPTSLAGSRSSSHHSHRDGSRMMRPLLSAATTPASTTDRSAAAPLAVARQREMGMPSGCPATHHRSMIRGRRGSAAHPHQRHQPSHSDGGGGDGEMLTPQRATFTVPIDQDGYNAILLDLDADFFLPVLNYLRHGAVMIPPHVHAQGVLSMAEYLNVSGLVEILRGRPRHKRLLLFSWGSGSNGELGTRTVQDEVAPTLVQVTPFGVRVKEIALGANYSCALSFDGNVYTFGNGEWGQLGLGNSRVVQDVSLSETPAELLIPRRIPLFEQLPAVHVAAGYAFAMAIAGADHQVYFWGNNNHGQSGLGHRYFDPHTKKVEEPVLVDTLAGKEVVQLSCGSFFALALTADGRLYSWGLVDCVGLGSPEEVQRRYHDVIGESLSNERRSVVLTPQLVSFKGSRGAKGGPECIVHVRAGQWHSGAINNRGELFTWGVGYQGRLGHGSKSPAYTPTLVRGALEGQCVVEVACGSFHTVALTATGAVFCWGDNASGQCGTTAGSPDAFTSPYRVVGLEYVAGGVARSIACGRQHTVVVMDGPQSWCPYDCCQLDEEGHPCSAHGQAYSFGETIRNGVSGAAAAAAAAAAAGSSGAGNAAASHHGVSLTISGPSLGSSAGAVPSSALPASAMASRLPALHRAVLHSNSHSGCTNSHFQLVSGLELFNVSGVVSGLHHAFAFAEEITSSAASAGGAGEREGGWTGAPAAGPSRQYSGNAARDGGTAAAAAAMAAGGAAWHRGSAAASSPMALYALPAASPQHHADPNYFGAINVGQHGSPSVGLGGHPYGARSPYASGSMLRRHGPAVDTRGDDERRHGVSTPFSSITAAVNAAWQRSLSGGRSAPNTDRRGGRTTRDS